MAYPAIVIAYAFVKRGIDEGNHVTQMKLQKMLYFAQGYHLFKYNETLINEPIEAWQYGPVIHSIYRKFKSYGSKPIDNVNLIDDNLEQLKFDVATLDDHAIDAINYTWGIMAALDALVLSAWSHKEGSPWQMVYDPKIRHNPIREGDIKHYFSEMLSAG